MRYCVLLSVLLPFAGVAQHLTNAGFEMTTDTGSVKPIGWYLGDGLTARSSTENPAEGHRSLRLQGSFTPSAPGYLVQRDTSRYVALQKLQVSVKVRVAAGASGIELIAYSSSDDGNTLNFQAVKALQGEEIGRWQELALTFWVNEQVRNLRIGLQVKDTVDLFVDDFSVGIAPHADAPIAPELASYADELLALITSHSLYRSTLDSASLRADLFRLLAGGQSLADLHAVVNYLLKRVDKHSMFWTKSEVEAWRGDDGGDDEEQSEALAFDFPVTSGHMIGEDVAYLRMPHFNSGNETWDTYFADKLQGLISTLDRPGLKGWVLDLRENRGGNCWPMLAGIGPVLGNGVCGYFGVDPDRSDWLYVAGRSLRDDTVQCAISRVPYELHDPNPRVAVLTGPNTASSGEVVAVAFRSRPGARSFGSPTAGYSTTNTQFTLSDGAILFLATSVYADRELNAYGATVPPDEEVKPEVGGDAPLDRAVQWLRSK